MNGKQAKLLRKAARKITKGAPETAYAPKVTRRGPSRTVVLAASTRGVNQQLKDGFKKHRQGKL